MLSVSTGLGPGPVAVVAGVVARWGVLLVPEVLGQLLVPAVSRITLISCSSGPSGPVRDRTGPAPGPADQLLGRLLLTRRLRLSFFFATFSSVAVITTPLPLNTLLSDQGRKHR